MPTNLPRLEVLELANVDLHDADFRHLEGLSRLRELIVTGPWLTDAALDHLAGLKHLRKILIDSPGITPRGKAKLHAALPELVFEGN